MAPLLREVAATAELVLDEYEKVESIRRQSAQAMVDAEERHKALLSGLLPDGWDRVQQFVDGLNGITAQRGLLLTIREYRYIDVARLDAMEAELLAAHERVAAATATFLASEQALQPLLERLQSLDGEAQKAETVAQLGEPLAALEAMAGDLDMLSSLMASLRIDDATQRTRIIESISEIYARLNQAKARAEQRRKGLGSSETVAQFGAQFKLFGQGITNALAQAQDPERCDEQLSRLLVQLEELESQFGDHEQFLGDILAKREELLETFEAHKQTLLDERQRKAQGLLDAARRILDSLQRRTARFTQAEELNAFFAADPLILKLRELAERLRELKDSVKADDVEARLKAARDQAVRALRDKSELFEEGGDVIRLGPRHRFSVNTQELDLTLMPRGDALYLHLTGTDFLEPLQDPRLDELRGFWQVNLSPNRRRCTAPNISPAKCSPPPTRAAMASAWSACRRCWRSRTSWRGRSAISPRRATRRATRKVFTTTMRRRSWFACCHCARVPDCCVTRLRRGPSPACSGAAGARSGSRRLARAGTQQPQHPADVRS